MLLVGGMGCAPVPYKQIPGTFVVRDTKVDTAVVPGGFRIALAVQCEQRIIDVWCPPGEECGKPPTVREREASCPQELDFRRARVSVRTPWGHIYSGMSDAGGLVEIPVDWAATEIDPLAADATEQLAAGWLVFTDEARAIPLKMDPNQVQQVRAQIGAATDTQYEVGAANEKAALTAEIGDGASLVLGQPGAIRLAIKNDGPHPAYRVIAKLRSSIAVLHGQQISFGRIDPHKTKIRTRSIALPPKLDERSALVVAEISYFNGEPIEAQKRFSIASAPETKRVASARGLALDCKPATTEVAPGERLRIDCELRNLGNEPASELGIAVSIGSVVSKNLAPRSLEGGGSTRLELIGLTSVGEKQGAEVPVIVRATALGLPPVERALSVRIASFATKCKTRLTRDEYKVKQKRLQAALDAGALTQKEFDKYDAELVSCLR